VGKHLNDHNPERLQDFKTGVKDFIAFLAKNYAGFKFYLPGDTIDDGIVMFMEQNKKDNFF